MPGVLAVGIGLTLTGFCIASALSGLSLLVALFQGKMGGVNPLTEKQQQNK
jgi:hypothetical protein